MDERILFISQDNVLQMALGSNLEKEGYTIECCTNHQAALDKAANWLPQVIVIDEALPHEEALKLAKTFSRLPQSNNTYVIVLAEAMEPLKMKAAYKAGVSFYILKQETDFRALLLTLQTIYTQLNRYSTFAIETAKISA